MPEICRFLGITIFMYHDDHEPPHFHVRYGGQRAVMEIGSSPVVRGRLSPRVLGMVVEWSAIHRAELLENWKRARRKEALNRIQPLE